MPEDEAGRLRVLVGDARGRPLAADGLARWLRRVAPSRARGTVSVALVSDRRIRELNKTYRRKDVATDVLSFPTDPSSSPRRTRRTRSTPRTDRGNRTSVSSVSSAVEISGVAEIAAVAESFLGDIVIARGVARRQARAAGHPERAELRVLALHGLLHLLGYDHDSDNGEMQRVERRLRRKGGLAAGLIERGSRPPRRKRS